MTNNLINTINDINANTKRRLLFLLGCIPSRLLLAYFVSNLKPEYLNKISYIAFFVSFMFIFLAISGTRNTGPETFGKKIWWTPQLRIVHGTIYLLFGIMSYQKNTKAYYLLYLDAFIGLISFLFHEFW